MNVKTNNYYGTYIRVLQKLVKNQRLLWKLYAGIAMNEECQRLFVPYMRVLQGMQGQRSTGKNIDCGRMLVNVG
jgi:hypothetical protein